MGNMNEAQMRESDTILSLEMNYVYVTLHCRQKSSRDRNNLGFASRCTQ